MCPKVLLVTDSLANGGAERQVTLLARYLPPEWDRRVWSWLGGPYEEVLRKDEIRLTVCPRAWRFDISPGLRLWREIFDWRPDVVHAGFGWMSSATCAVACRALGIPFIDGRMRNGQVSRRLIHQYKLGLSLATRVVANSEAGLRALGVGPARGRVIYNSFERQRLVGLNCRRPEEAYGRTIVVMVARMQQTKDYATYMEAARTLARRDPDRWLFVAVGDGPHREELAREAADLVEQGCVVFPPPSLEVLQHVCSADIGVLMTDPRYGAEGCSNALIEYMACGLPCVASQGGGNAELVEDGITGYLVPPRDSRRLVSRLQFLADHPATARRLGRTGRARSLSRFAEERLLRETVSLYEEAMAIANSSRGTE
ncbi:MAG: glycosyltransferase [Armatimonadetes bacterium]|nr:glycosyltransferase [Armatimonadota bacterium]